MEDVTGFFNQPKIHQTEQDGPTPKLDDWIELVIGNRVVISGVINNHPNYENGQRIVTSSLQGYKTSADGKVHAKTKRSRYELGQRLSEYDAQQLSAARNSFEKVFAPGKKTIC
ncbi:hypothetical protein [Acaryochloris sp. CCMEE 5410]|uniref:hypothetical protein n=1 Tax=Acaryochloris sp. CCMEE 5410 TaxID=310037 RepID=UPI00024842BB|nr:hypothetical protein [Acaryochloris sp. CCMEE 5410]KAI9129392.1 hypothetical protein ON05_035330 [Acaryochloris sp. CCMEE 5410]